ncbi:translocation/assembly module TamB domain-containing protein [Kaistia terrae]|uniref:Translocation/assembly module TamB domain-containing protein n=1 Tax=Kaistia terrae TaxID=537017 RepID=A0ABW0PWY9_9HYPH|nr:translocation/assembly module TamB domain-containing protein [Kaistia terrae]MCX5580592.1 translocation/assembly module TamB domain-containing protein [Kaistia terrae]
MSRALTILRWFGVGFLAVLIALVALFGFLQTGPGLRTLANLGSKLASSDGLTVKIDGISGFVPSNMRIARIDVADTTGPFAQVENLHLAWHPLSLISGKVAITDLAADRVAVSRKPVLPPSPPSTSSGGGIPFIRVALDRLDIAKIELGEPVLGMAATLNLQASARLVDLAEGLSLDFALVREDAPGEIKGRARYAPGNGTDSLYLDVTASEPAGGLVARLAQIEGLPALSLSVKGNAPLDNWDGQIALDAGAAGHLGGTAAVKQVEDGRRIMLDLAGEIAGLVPATVRPLFAEQTTLIGSAVVGQQGHIAIEGLNATASGFGLALVGKLDTTAKTADLKLDLVGGDPSHFAALAPGVTWSGWRLNAAVNGAFSAPSVDATLSAQDLAGAGYGAKDLQIVAKTTPANGGGLAFTVDGSAAGLSAADPQVSAALGQSAKLTAAGSLGDAGPVLTDAKVTLEPLDLSFAGSAAPKSVQGALRLERLNLAAFSGLAGRPLSGSAVLDAKIDADPSTRRIAVDLDGTSKAITTGIKQVDDFFADESRVKGAVSLAEDGRIAVNGLTLAAKGLDVAIDGGIEKSAADLTARVKLADLKQLDPRVSGAASADLRFTGGLDALGLTGKVAIPAGMAMDQKIENLALTVDLTDLTRLPGGTFALDGKLAGKPAKGGAKLTSLADGGRRLDNLDLAIGSVRAKGAAALASTGLIDGKITIAASNLADLSALILTDIAGKLDATIVLDASNGAQRVAVDANAQGVEVAGNRVDKADINARIADLFGTPVIDGKAVLAGVRAGGQVIQTATVTAKSAGTSTDVTLDTALLGADIDAKARISPAGEATNVRLDTLRIARSGTNVTLSAPSNITIAKGGVSIDKLALATGDGRANISGKAGETLDLNVDLRNLPLSLASLVAPTLDMKGTLSGTARVTGKASAPAGDYDLRVAKLTNGDIAKAGLGPFDITARGKLGGGRVGVEATIKAPSVSGLTINGSVPIASGDMDLKIKGAIDLAIANTALATSGGNVRGKAVIDAALGGPTSAPRASGTVRVSGASYNDSLNGIALSNIETVLTGSDRAINVSSFSAQTVQGGRIVGKGNVALDPAQGFPAAIEMTLQKATLVSSDLMRLVADGKINIQGPVATRPKIAGQINVRSLDINIADKISGGLDPLDVRHVNTGKGKSTAVKGGMRAQAQARASATAKKKATPPSAFVADLDLKVSAPNGVFVRGMGMDAEFGGDLTLRGTTADMVTLGGFNLKRGRFSVVGRQLTFTEGTITFNGSLDPELNFKADTSGGDVVASIIISGNASAPEVSFTSTPTLPQDEVIARLLFGRSISTLTAGQALQVAQTVAQFSGGGPGVVDAVRRSLGVDTLSIGTDETGKGGQIGAGKRLNDKIYVGVQQGTSPDSSKVTVDVDLTRNIRIQGAAGADGSNEIGIGAQWDY